MTRTITMTLTASALALASAGAALAAPEVTLKLSTAAPENSPWASQVSRLAEDVKAESDGRVELEIFYSSQLGAENEVIAKVARGRVDMGLFTMSSLTLQAPELGVLDMPLFFETPEQRSCVLDEHMVAPASEALAEKGIHFGGWFEVGNGFVMANEELPSPEAFAGKKIGITMNEKNDRLFALFGGSGVATSVPEAASNASTGLIDGYATVYSFYVPSGLNEILPVVTEFRYSDGPAVVAVSQRIWDGLSDENKDALNRAFAKVPATQIRDEIFAFEDKLREAHLASGGTIRTLSDEETAAFRDILPPLWEQLGTGQGDAAKAMYDAMLAAREACGA